MPDEIDYLIDEIFKAVLDRIDELENEDSGIDIEQACAINYVYREIEKMRIEYQPVHKESKGESMT